MIPGTLTLEAFTEGDLWEGIPAFLITVNGVAPSADIESVTMRFNKAGCISSDVVELTSATPGQITIVDAANWEIEVPEQAVTGLTYGKWKFRIKIKPVGLAARTYIADEITVLETV